MGKKCWAQEYSTCAGPISKEHILSACSQVGKEVTLTPPFSDEERTVGANSVTARILCARHNSILGDSLDEYSGLAMKNIFKAHSANVGDISGAEMIEENHYRLTVDGIKLERWFCKLLVNIMASNYTLLPGMPRFYQPPRLELVKFIFEGTEPMMSPYGLYGAAPWVNLFPNTKTQAQHIRAISIPVEHFSKKAKRWSAFTLPKMLLYRNATTNFILNVGCTGGHEEIIKILRDDHKIELKDSELEYRPIAQKNRINNITRTICYYWPDERKRPPECCI